MLKQFLEIFRKDNLLQQAFDRSVEMLELDSRMFTTAVESLRRRDDARLDMDVYAADQKINHYEREVRRKAVTHLALGQDADLHGGMVLISIVIDIERIGDYMKNIVELAIAQPGSFTGGEIEDEIRNVEEIVHRMFAELIPTLDDADVNKARQILGDHQMVVERVEESLGELIAGNVLNVNSGDAVVAALYLRYLKRVSAHLKNIATSVVNPYYRIGFREKGTDAQAGASQS